MNKMQKAAGPMRPTSHSPPFHALLTQVSGENTLNSGEISRDLVADVCVAALSDPKASNKVVEIVESAPGKPGENRVHNKTQAPRGVPRSLTKPTVCPLARATSVAR